MRRLKGRILESNYDKDTGTTYVKKATKYGTFSAVAKCHPEDEDIKSEWIGYQLAEKRCDLKAMKRRINNIKASINGLENFWQYQYYHCGLEDEMLANYIANERKYLEKEESLYKKAKDDLKEDAKIFVEEYRKFYNMVKDKKK